MRCYWSGLNKSITSGNALRPFCPSLKYPLAIMASSAKASDTKPGEGQSDPVLKWERHMVAWGIDYLPDGELAVLTHISIRVFTDEGRLTRHYIGDNLKPVVGGTFWGLSVGKIVYKVAILEGRGRKGMPCIHAYTPEGNDWRVDLYDVCESPRRLCVTGSGGYLVYNEKKKLYSYNGTGDPLWFIDVPDMAMEMCVDHTDRIFVCTGGRLIVYDKGGKLATLLSQTSLYSAAVTGRGQILVGNLLNKEDACRWEHKYHGILSYDSDYKLRGKLLYLFGYSRPQKMAVYKNNRLAVWGDRLMRVYKLE